MAQVDKDLRTMLLKPDAPQPRVVGVRVWPRAIPQFNIGHGETLDKAKQVGVWSLPVGWRVLGPRGGWWVVVAYPPSRGAGAWYTQLAPTVCLQLSALVNLNDNLCAGRIVSQLLACKTGCQQMHPATPTLWTVSRQHPGLQLEQHRWARARHRQICAT